MLNVRRWKKFLLEESPKRELRTYASFAIIINEDGRILILKRPDNFLSNAGKWTFPGGGNLEDENPLDTAVRETLEETGIQLNRDSLSFLDSFSEKNKPKHFFKIHCKECKDVDSKAVEDEHVDFKWIRADELDNYNMMSGMDMLIRKALGQMLL